MRLRTVGVISGLVALAATAVAYGSLPDSVPIHWNAWGEADNWAPRLSVAVGGPLFVFGIWGLFEVLARIDPRRSGLQGGGRETIFMLSQAMLGLLYLAFLARATGLVEGNKPIFVVVGLFMALLGNYLGRVRPNWFAGVRTPWTLSDDENWRRTNRLAGKTFVAAGLVIVAAALVFEGPAVAAVVVGAALLASLIPGVYSYLFWRRNRRAAGM